MKSAKVMMMMGILVWIGLDIFALAITDAENCLMEKKMKQNQNDFKEVMRNGHPYLSKIFSASRDKIMAG